MGGSHSESGDVMDELEITINNDIAGNELIPELQTAKDRKGFMTLKGMKCAHAYFNIAEEIRSGLRVSSVVMEIWVVDLMYVTSVTWQRYRCSKIKSSKSEDVRNFTLKIHSLINNHNTIPLQWRWIYDDSEVLSYVLAG